MFYIRATTVKCNKISCMRAAKNVISQIIRYNITQNKYYYRVLGRILCMCIYIYTHIHICIRSFIIKYIIKQKMTQNYSSLLLINN